MSGSLRGHLQVPSGSRQAARGAYSESFGSSGDCLRLILMAVVSSIFIVSVFQGVILRILMSWRSSPHKYALPVDGSCTSGRLKRCADEAALLCGPSAKMCVDSGSRIGWSALPPLGSDFDPIRGPTSCLDRRSRIVSTLLDLGLGCGCRLNNSACRSKALVESFKFLVADSAIGLDGCRTSCLTHAPSLVSTVSGRTRMLIVPFSFA